MIPNNPQPAPWLLHGKGYMFLLKLSKQDIEKDIFLNDFFKERFKGGFGAMMLVEYWDSNAGPYNELLFIPGKFSYNNQKKNTISKIYVSSMDSVENGINNWAIPKELADINFVKQDSKTEQIMAKKDGKVFFDLTVKSFGIKFPIHTAFMPFPLVQLKDGKSYYTNFSGSGMAKFVKIKNLEIVSSYFPKISKKQIFAGIKIEPFKICFPEAIVRDNE